MNRNIERIMGMKDSGSGITSSPLIISAMRLSTTRAIAPLARL
jgi:hypothetical protein